MNPYQGKTCPYCQTPFREYDDVVTCSICEMPHHRACWLENGGCTTFGCGGQMRGGGVSAMGAVAPGVCASCGAMLESDAAFCTVCGKPVGAAPPPTFRAAPPSGATCSACGTPLEAGSVFCTVCGTRNGAPVLPDTPSFETTPCPSCGGTLDMSGTCGRCGYGKSALSGNRVVLPSAAPVASTGGDTCPGCGFPLEPDAMFCVNCGMQMNGGSGGARIRSTVSNPNRRELTPAEKAAVKRNLHSAGDL